MNYGKWCIFVGMLALTSPAARAFEDEEWRGEHFTVTAKSVVTGRYPLMSTSTFNPVTQTVSVASYANHYVRAGEICQASRRARQPTCLQIDSQFRNTPPATFPDGSFAVASLQSEAYFFDKDANLARVGRYSYSGPGGGINNDPVLPGGRAVFSTEVWYQGLELHYFRSNGDQTGTSFYPGYFFQSPFILSTGESILSTLVDASKLSSWVYFVDDQGKVVNKLAIAAPYCWSRFITKADEVVVTCSGGEFYIATKQGLLLSEFKIDGGGIRAVAPDGTLLVGVQVGTHGTLLRVATDGTEISRVALANSISTLRVLPDGTIAAWIADKTDLGWLFSIVVLNSDFTERGRYEIGTYAAFDQEWWTRPEGQRRASAPMAVVDAHAQDRQQTGIEALQDELFVGFANGIAQPSRLIILDRDAQPVYLSKPLPSLSLDRARIYGDMILVSGSYFGPEPGGDQGHGVVLQYTVTKQ